MTGFGQSLDTILAHAEQLQQVRKADLRFGDWVIVQTRNSIYSIRVSDGDCYLISGGWFDQKGLSPIKTTIAGCTWGGSMIKVDIVAACGLSLEFGNRVVTSTIQKIFVVPNGSVN